MKRAFFLACIASLASATPGLAQDRAPPTLIFFNWGKSEPISGSSKTLDEVAASFRTKSDARLVLTGHADRSGSAAVNRNAGTRRASFIRDELVKRGVPAQKITVQSDGEARPLVMTEDGVREVQNRRVEIQLVGN